LDQLSRATDPSKEALEQLEFLLETRPLARKAFGAELVRLRRFAALVRANEYYLPKKLKHELEAMPKTKSFDHLVALADSKGDPQPELDLTT
jgi:hypothetical protein